MTMFPEALRGIRAAALSRRISRQAAGLGAFTLLALSGCVSTPHPADGTTAPYPRSRYITGAEWDFSMRVSHRKAHGSDLWPCAWASDGNLYCAWGDGGGFDGDSDTTGRVSLGFARVAGVPDAADADSLTGKNVWGAAPDFAEHPATFGGKVTSLISVRGTLYGHGDLWTVAAPDATQRGGAGPVHTRIWSADLGRTWKVAPWSDEWSQTFLSFGPDNAGAPGDFVYIYYTRPTGTQRIYLKRIPAAALEADPTSRAFEYFTGLAWWGRPRGWSRDESLARPVFVDRNGTDAQVVYDAPLRRYLLTSGHGPKAGQVGLFEAPQPWGPWRTVGYYDNWGNLAAPADGEYLGVSLPAKWIGADGRTLWALFSALGEFDSFNLARVTLTLSATERR
ncbi:MAG TPA: DUF4185 domain-containing protein [Steroidobacteraceae bacterium]|nr:DUF4185 domain-containing protein [Steroidobacteraceae bacterium]